MDAGQRIEGAEGHEDAALVGADTCLPQPAIDGVRLAEDQELRAQRRLAAGAQDHVARLQVAEFSFSTSQGWMVKSRAGSKPIKSADSSMAADAGMLDPRNLLRRGAAHARQLRLGKEIGVEHQVGGFDRQERGGDVGQAPLPAPPSCRRPCAVKPTAMLRSIRASGRAREDDAARHRDRGDQQEAAGLAPTEILARPGWQAASAGPGVQQSLPRGTIMPSTTRPCPLRGCTSGCASYARAWSG